MAGPYAFSNFPNPPRFKELYWNFSKLISMGDWDWAQVGHTAPSDLLDLIGSGIQLGSGSANQNDYIQIQKIGADIQPNSVYRLGKKMQFIWNVQASSDTLTQIVCAVTDTNTKLTGSIIQNGFGFMANLTGLVPGYWYSFLANMGTVSVLQGAPVDAGMTQGLGIEVVMDSQVQGSGSFSFWVEGAPSTEGFGNSGGGANISTSLLKISTAMGNATAVAQHLILHEMGQLDQT